VPYSACGGAGSSTDPATWSSYQEAVAKVGRFDGLGFAITDGNMLVDLDGCRNVETGIIESWAQDIVDHLVCPTEIFVRMRPAYLSQS
jgi:primase-polymerase (primpol)-like protein